MSADLLREAAALMRSRAEGATGGRWVVSGDGIYVNPDWTDEGWLTYDALVAEVSDSPDEAVTEDDAEHIASWHPAVALAVADWLDDHAETAELFTTKAIPTSAWSMNWQTSHNRA